MPERDGRDETEQQPLSNVGKRRSLDDYPRFDPKVSAEAGVRILRAAGVPFALAGRVAVWTYVPAEGQAFTKDVDFAVPYGYADAIEEAARERGFESSRLSIGGVGVKKGDISVDFIDRQPIEVDDFGTVF